MNATKMLLSLNNTKLLNSIALEKKLSRKQEH